MERQLQEMERKHEESMADMVKQLKEMERKQKEKDKQSKKAQEALENKVQELLAMLEKLSSGAQDQK